MKKGTMLCLALLLALLLGACAPARTPGPEAGASVHEAGGREIVVGFSQVGAESDWRLGNTQSMIDAFSAQNGYRLILDDAQNKQERQITAIRNFINQGVDYIVLAPTTERGWETVLGEAKAAGIPVILVDRRIEVEDEDLYVCWVGSDFRREGDAAAAWMEEHLPEELRIVHLQGNLGSSAQIGRSEGLADAVARHPGWTVVFEAPGDFVQAKGQELIESLPEDLEYDVIYAENDNMAFGAIDALKKAGIRPGKDVVLLSFDAGGRALRLVLGGEINLDVECNPMHGPRVRSVIEQLERGETPAKYTYVEETWFDAETLTAAEVDSRGY